eukprot:COSAG05_NODE_1438_length_4885_cov_3.395529_1_plen_459_part_00
MPRPTVDIDAGKAYGQRHAEPTPGSMPTAAEIAEYAVKALGIDPSWEFDLLWIAEEALTAPLPGAWAEYLDDDSGQYYFYDEASGEVQWTSPMLEHYRAMVKKERAGVAADSDEDSAEQQFPSSSPASYSSVYSWSASDAGAQPGSSQTEGSSSSQGGVGGGSGGGDRSTFPAEGTDKEKVAWLRNNWSAATAYEDVDLEDLIAFCTYMGVSPREVALLPIVDEAMNEPCPQGWKELEDETGQLYYYHQDTKQTAWSHPKDTQFRARLAAAREGGGASPGGSDADGHHPQSSPPPSASVAARERTPPLQKGRHFSRESDSSLPVDASASASDSEETRAAAGAPEPEPEPEPEPHPEPSKPSPVQAAEEEARRLAVERSRQEAASARKEVKAARRDRELAAAQTTRVEKLRSQQVAKPPPTPSHPTATSSSRAHTWFLPFCHVPDVGRANSNTVLISEV